MIRPIFKNVVDTPATQPSHMPIQKLIKKWKNCSVIHFLNALYEGWALCAFKHHSSKFSRSVIEWDAFLAWKTAHPTYLELELRDSFIWPVRRYILCPELCYFQNLSHFQKKDINSNNLILSLFHYITIWIFFDCWWCIELVRTDAHFSFFTNCECFYNPIDQIRLLLLAA